MGEPAGSSDSIEPATDGSSEAETVVGDSIDADVGDPVGADVDDLIDAGVDASSHVVVVGYDAWTEPVLEQLADLDVSVTVITTDDATATRLRERAFTVVDADDVDEACFREAGIDRADAVLVATLDDQRNVLAVLTVMNVDESMRVVTFAGERQDVPKLRAAGADRVVGIGQAVGELLVEVALSERDVSEVVEELLGDRS